MASTIFDLDLDLDLDLDDLLDRRHLRLHGRGGGGRRLNHDFLGDDPFHVSGDDFLDDAFDRDLLGDDLLDHYFLGDDLLGNRILITGGAGDQKDGRGGHGDRPAGCHDGQPIAPGSRKDLASNPP